MNTIQYSLNLKTIILSVMGIVTSLSLVIGMKYYQSQARVVLATPIILDNPTPTKILELETSLSQISSDGTKKLIMKTTSNEGGVNKYALSVSDGSGANEQIVFEKTLDIKKNITIPFNTWSPDNKYFFIQEHEGEKNIVLAFKASGEPFNTEEKYLNVTDLFEKYDNKNNLNEATGWASQNLIIFNTTTQDNIKGPSYWFEVPSKAIIPLSIQF
ncbi:MAG: hypothetical protein ABH812_01370 [bacterium]